MNRSVIILLLAALMLLTLAACKTVDVPVASTQENISGAVTIPEEFLDETAPSGEETLAGENAEVTEEAAETEAEEEPEETTAATEEATEVPTETVAKLTEFEWYNALSGEEQMAYMESFDSLAAFFDWYNAAKDEYEQLHPSIEIGNGEIDLGDLLGGNG